MAPNTQDLLWILDGDPACVTLYQQTLGLQYNIRTFDNIDDFTQAYITTDSSDPRLLLADPETTKGSLSEFLRQPKSDGNPIPFPEVMIVSRIDDIELMRFYLKAGARDYVLKPIRPNELVAKIERALYQISNREILILRNDLDGRQVENLTFREHQLLTIFLSRPDRCVGREELYNAVWNKVTVNRKTLDVHLFNLRRKLRPLGYDITCQEQIFALAKYSPRPAMF